MVAVSLLTAPAAFAAEMTKKVNIYEFMKECDMDHDQMMSTAEMLKRMEKMFDKVDVKKAGKRDKTRTESFFERINTIGGG